MANRFIINLLKLLKMYKITQNIKQPNNWFGLRRKDKIQVHTFETYKEALIFALNEQHSYFYKHIGTVRTCRHTFAKYLTCKQFCKVAIKNPMHYTGTTNADKLNLERLYFYYVNSGNLHRIQKFIINK